VSDTAGSCDSERGVLPPADRTTGDTVEKTHFDRGHAIITREQGHPPVVSAVLTRELPPQTP